MSPTAGEPPPATRSRKAVAIPDQVPSTRWASTTRSRSAPVVSRRWVAQQGLRLEAQPLEHDADSRHRVHDHLDHRLVRPSSSDANRPCRARARPTPLPRLAGSTTTRRPPTWDDQPTRGRTATDSTTSPSSSATARTARVSSSQPCNAQRSSPPGLAIAASSLVPSRRRLGEPLGTRLRRRAVLDPRVGSEVVQRAGHHRHQDPPGVGQLAVSPLT